MASVPSDNGKGRLPSLWGVQTVRGPAGMAVDEGAAVEEEDGVGVAEVIATPLLAGIWDQPAGRVVDPVAQYVVVLWSNRRLAIFVIIGI